jgi:hypothetical protein
MTRDILLFLESSNAQAVILKRLNEKSRSVYFKSFEKNISVLFCGLISDDGYYLRVKVPYPTKEEPKACALFLIPHNSVLMVVKADREKILGFGEKSFS